MDLSVDAQSWQWDFGDGNSSAEPNPLHDFREPGTYRVTLTVVDSRGCVHSYALSPYRVLAPELFIPNVFTPNADGINDVFRPDYSGVEPYALQIFDRWGTLVFSHQGSPAEGWDGYTPSGAPASEGVYYYLIQVGEKAYQGNVVLMR